MMKKLSALIILAFLLSNHLAAQPKTARYGKVSISDLEMKFYERDSSAHAVILFDRGMSALAYNPMRRKHEALYYRHVRIKILTKDGFDYANFSIPYVPYRQRERLTTIKGSTFYMADGKKMKATLNESDIIDEKVNNRLAYKNFSMPKITEGAIIDVIYEIASDYIAEIRDWNFQYTIPVVLSSFRAEIPNYFTYNINVMGYENVKTSRSATGQSKTYRYTAEHVPALPLEEYVDNPNNYRNRVEFELSSTHLPGQDFRKFSFTWNDVVKELLEAPGFGGQLSDAQYIHEEIHEVFSDSLKTEDQLKVAFDFIKQKISWNKRYSAFTSKGADSAFSRGVGNSAEVNFNLILLLRKLGFEAYPVALSTRDNGKIFPQQVTITKFNHVIALVKGEDRDYLIDATSEFPNPFVLPFHCLNEKGRIIDADLNDWVMLDPTTASRAVMVLESFMDEQGQLQGNVKTQFFSYNAQAVYLETIQDSELESLAEGLSEAFSHAEIEIEKSEFLDQNHDRFCLDYSFITSEAALITDKMIYISPMPGFAFDVNPFRQIVRKLPVNFAYPQDIQYTNQYKIPNGYTIEDLPENISFSLPDGACRFLFSASVINDLVLINARLQLNRIIFTADEYESLSTFFNSVIKKQEEKLVLKKSD